MRAKDGRGKDRGVRPGGRALERRRQFLEARGLLPDEDKDATGAEAEGEGDGEKREGGE